MNPTDQPTQPTIQPTMNPTNQPTQPTIQPTIYPSNQPSEFTINPTTFPTICYNDKSKISESNGLIMIDDFRDNRLNKSSSNTVTYQNIANSQIDFHKQNNEDICIIECLSTESCIGSKVKIEETQLSEVIIDCTGILSCAELSITISNSDIDSVSILCALSQSCDNMIINIISPSKALELFTLCTSDNACDHLLISGDYEFLTVNLTLSKYSSDIVIQSSYINNINVECEVDNEYIKYDTNKLMSIAAMKRTAEKQFTSNKLPCDDVSISCTENTECEFTYTMSTYFANGILPQILEGKNATDCLWVNINDIYDIECNGNCKSIENTYAFTEQNVSFNLDITFKGDNNEQLTGIPLKNVCQTYFSTIYDTQISVDSIDVIFVAILTVLKSTMDQYTIINELTNLPNTQLRNALQYVECESMQQPLKLETHLTISLGVESRDDSIMYALFDDESEFIKQSKAPIEELFQVAVTINITIIDTVFIPGESTGIGMEILLVVCICSFCIVVILIASIIILKRRRKRQRNADTIYISNAMVIAISIGIYDDEAKAPEIEGYLPDLNGVDIDIINICKLYKDTLQYNIYPHYSAQNGVKQHWTKKEIVKLLQEKAKDLNNMINTYDGLIVFFSCHGDDDYLLTSDYKKLYKIDVHRAFSIDYPEVRRIPRIFCFDSCSGNNDRDSATRNEINEAKRFNEMEQKIFNEMEQKLPAKGVEVAEINANSEPNLAAQNSVLWTKDEMNPDYRLVVISSSNKGFESKLTSNMGSYCIQKLTEKIKNNFLHFRNERFLVEVVHEVQTELHDRGKQLIDATYNNKCDYIKFKANEGNKSENIEMGILNQ
eukprot:160493_1